MEKAHTRAFSRLKTTTSAFTFKTLLRHRDCTTSPINRFAALSSSHFTMVGSDKYWTVYCDFLLSVMGCKKRQPAQFEDLSTKSILEKILRMNKSQKSHRKLFSEDKKGLRRFRSSPNIYAEVTGNFSLKPTISIKRGHTDKLGGNYRFCDFASEKEYKSLSASLD